MISCMIIMLKLNSDDRISIRPHVFYIEVVRIIPIVINAIVHELDPRPRYSGIPTAPFHY